MFDRVPHSIILEILTSPLLGLTELSSISFSHISIRKRSFILSIFVVWTLPTSRIVCVRCSVPPKLPSEQIPESSSLLSERRSATPNRLPLLEFGVLPPQRVFSSMKTFSISPLAMVDLSKFDMVKTGGKKTQIAGRR